MKKILIVSPNFPPVNGADMHRVRQSLPYFKEFGWEATVLAVDPDYVELAKDDLLEESIPKDSVVYKVTAFSAVYTRKLGLGNLGIRAFFQLYRKGNQLIKQHKFDLIYFSTTVFACMPLGRLWKQKFKIPFVIDMQDPWRNDYHLSTTKDELPPKFWFAYRLNKFLERFTIPEVNGLIAVSSSYINTLKERYPQILQIPSKTLTFGAHPIDLEIASKIKDSDMEYKLDLSKINIVYAGVVPKNMLFSIEAIFRALKKGLDTDVTFDKVHFHFIGTNYAIGKAAKSTLGELIIKYQLEEHVIERTERVPYFEALKLVQQSNLAILPGTLDKHYTASKLYPYILTKTPIIAIFHKTSSVIEIMKELDYGTPITFDQNTKLNSLADEIYQELLLFLKGNQDEDEENNNKFEKYMSKNNTKVQTDFFEKVVNNAENKL